MGVVPVVRWDMWFMADMALGGSGFSCRLMIDSGDVFVIWIWCFEWMSACGVLVRSVLLFFCSFGIRLLVDGSGIISGYVSG